MRQLRDAVVTLGSRLNPSLLAVLVLALNVYWLVILAVINREFQGVTNGHPLLDLQNSLAPGEIITPAKVLEQLGDYTGASKFIYWVFFALDNIMPHLAFGSIALLWVYSGAATPTASTTGCSAATPSSFRWASACSTGSRTSSTSWRSTLTRHRIRSGR